jgi:hypothetical protein
MKKISNERFLFLEILNSRFITVFLRTPLGLNITVTQNAVLLIVSPSLGHSILQHVGRSIFGIHISNSAA